MVAGDSHKTTHDTNAVVKGECISCKKRAASQSTALEGGEKKEKDKKWLWQTQKKTVSTSLQSELIFFNYVVDDAALRPCVHVRLCM